MSSTSPIIGLTEQKVNSPKFTFLSSIDIGFCPVNQPTIKICPLENNDSSILNFFFEESMEFKVTPKSGHILPKSKMNISISFTPTEATAIVSVIVLRIDGEEFPIKISAIGKYPFLSINTMKLDFQTLLVTKQLTKELIIKNQSQVEANFYIKQILDDEFKDFCFSLDVKEGRIPPKSSFLIKITFRPTVVSLISVAHFNIECPGGNLLTFECTGMAIGYEVHLSSMSINFGEVKINNSSSRLLTINNESEMTTKYEFFNDQGGIFEFANKKGKIKGKSNVRIIIKFTPKQTICYYERVYCIVRNHCLLYVDLIGYCYDLLIKPLPLTQNHVDMFRRRVIEGRISKIDFKYLENSMTALKPNNNNNNDSIKKTNASLMITPTKEGAFGEDSVNMQDDSQGNFLENQTVLHKELILELKSDKRILQFSEDFLDFGFCDLMTVSGPRDLEVFNRLPTKLTIFWTITSHFDNENCVFNVTPKITHLKPGSSQVFTVTFRPVKSSYYFFQCLQLFAIKYNSNLTERMIEDAKNKTITGQQKSNIFQIDSFNQTMKSKISYIADELFPSLYANIRCVGHSFSSNSQPFIPMIDVNPNDLVVFPPCSMNDSVYQCVELINKTDTPTYFKFSPDVNKTFRVFPTCGIIEGKSFCLIILEFNPKLPKTYSGKLTCSLNHYMGNLITINVFGYCSEPKLNLQNEGKIYFPPSFTGVYSRQKIKIQNMARVPVEYNIEIPKKYENEIYFEPKTTKLKPNECILLDCSFIPFKKKQYKINVPITVSDINDANQEIIGYYFPGSGNERNMKELKRIRNSANYNFEIIGAGGDGSLKITPELIDFGIVKVNFNEKFYFVLENFSNYMFYVELVLKPVEEQKKLDMKLQNFIQKSFTLDFANGIIAANSKVEIGITFHPTEVCDLDLYLECIAKERNFKGISKVSNSKKLFIQKCCIRVRGKGNYPLLRIVDVRNDSVSVATLWENFSINKINKELMNDLNEDEKKFLQIETLNFAEATSLMKRLQAYIWNFGYLPIKENIKPRKIIITIKNVGGTDLNWNFKLPSDSQIEVEPWADPGEPTEDEAFEKAILERNIFSIKPKSGFLKKDEICDIELIYSPGNEDQYSIMEGKKGKRESERHFLQVVLQILNGKPLLLQFKGMTLAPMEGLLAVRKFQYTLPDVPIGSLIPVTFPIEISNEGNTNIQYKCEITETDGEDTNKGTKYKIFDIEKPSGSLQAFEKQYLFCLFRPLEKKKYTFEVQINVNDLYKKLDTITLKIEGKGYVKREIEAAKRKEITEELPSQRSSVSPIGSNVFFSIEDIDFGEVEPGKSEYRIFILYNLSQKNKLTFKFKSTGLVCGDELFPEPASGELDCGQFVEIKLTLISNPLPSIYEGEIECVIFWVQTPSAPTHLEKETLFLRIKKKSKLSDKLQVMPNEYNPSENDPKKHPFEIILSKAIIDILNDPYLDSQMKNIDNQPVQLYSKFDGQEPAGIDKVGMQIDQPVEKNNKTTNYKDYNNLFLCEEFTELVDYMMENTFFNIIQETTRKESDLLRLSKTFLIPNK